MCVLFKTLASVKVVSVLTPRASTLIQQGGMWVTGDNTHTCMILCQDFSLRQLYLKKKQEQIAKGCLSAEKKTNILHGLKSRTKF